MNRLRYNVIGRWRRFFLAPAVLLAIVLASGPAWAQDDVCGGLDQGPLRLTKTCAVLASTQGSFDCKDGKPIDTLTLIWVGDETVDVQAWKGEVGGTALEEFTGVDPGEHVVVSGLAGSPNDIYLEIFEAGNGGKLMGVSRFHLSCSDADMNGPEDCGKHLGDGKDKKGPGKKEDKPDKDYEKYLYFLAKYEDKGKEKDLEKAEEYLQKYQEKSSGGGYITDWVLEGMGGVDTGFACTPEPVSECIVESPPESGHCSDRLSALTLQYVGGGCGDADNSQGDSTSCGGSDLDAAAPDVSIEITRDAAYFTHFRQGDRVTFTHRDGKPLKPNLEFTATDTDSGDAQFLRIHTSCSVPLDLGDRFGAFEVVSMVLRDGSVVSREAEVMYTIRVDNTGDDPLYDVVVEDPPGEVVGEIDVLGAGKSVEFTRTAYVDATTDNTAVAYASLDEGAAADYCSDGTANVIVDPEPPVECLAAGGEFLNIRDNRIEWEIFNGGANPVTIDKLRIYWPSGAAQYGAIKRISLNGVIQDQPIPGPGLATITTWTGDPAARQVPANGSGKLIIEFQNRYQNAIESNFLIIVDFEEGCRIRFDKDFTIPPDGGNGGD